MIDDGNFHNIFDMICIHTISLKGLLSTVEKATLDREKEVGLFTLYKLSKSLAVHNTAPFKGTLASYSGLPVVFQCCVRKTKQHAKA